MSRGEFLPAGREGLADFRFARSLLPASVAWTTLLLPSGARAADVTFGDGGSVRVVEGTKAFQLGGRAVASAAFYDEDVTDLPTGLEMSLMLLNLRGDLGQGVTFNVGYDFVGKSFFDTSITKSGWAIGDVQVGQFRPQIGLFDGGAWIIFNQRSMIEQALTIPRTLGIGLEGRAGRVSYGLAVNGDQIDRDTPGQDPLKYSGRFVVRPAPAGWGVFHVGVNAIHHEVPDSKINRFAVDPVAALEDTPVLLSASQFPADYRTVLGGEALWQHGRFTVQSEYMRAAVNAPGDPSIDGYYVQGTYLVGAERRYAEQGATIGRPVLWNPAAGAWELALRYDTIDMSRAGGGSSDNIGIAIVRYISNPLRLAASITHSDITNGRNGNEDILSIHLRAQWFL